MDEKEEEEHFGIKGAKTLKKEVISYQERLQNYQSIMLKNKTESDSMGVSSLDMQRQMAQKCDFMKETLEKKFLKIEH